MKNIAIFGSTGSIGKNALSVIRRFPDKFRVVGLSASSDIRGLYSQIKEFHPSFVCIRDKESAFKLKKGLGSKIRVYSTDEGLIQFAQEKSIDQSLFAISGSAALAPLISSIASGKDIALANKEALVMAGPLIMRMAKKAKVKVIPIDSEQSAIWQCLYGQDRVRLKTIYLTASGGPLLNESDASLRRVSLLKVLKHPRWKMGKKITVDSATLMNKGLEFLEAMFLFNVSHKMIKVLIHPQALVHSMVEFVDGVVLAQLSKTDMRIPIQYALSYPDRLNGFSPGINFYNLKALNFSKPDCLRFPCLSLAYQAAKELGSLPAVMNAANEVAVSKFLSERIKFMDIPKIVAKVMRNHRNNKAPGLNDILKADVWARQEAYGLA
ncbi:MAG: 1-deoxy-D-xylulose-5-phosphate reductoisomerase [Candidatus Omnitrophota bacterium]|jgi:1-deoxy-D-xylulose-5-phosphate reductoisomerase|nr:1-deoxy-D-xylulose-5-phosphate reductoisomerase [Candidatus Omnitrophota bacterium]MDD5664565.1 1-deoxy-D-xylulose-5-phosphate reductoisomerase [Candidatus Omnitrophota bacterium]